MHPQSVSIKRTHAELSAQKKSAPPSFRSDCETCKRINTIEKSVLQAPSKKDGCVLDPKVAAYPNGQVHIFVTDEHDTNAWGSISYPNGDGYLGYINASGLPDKKGSMCYHDSHFIYEGDWQNNTRHGIGKWTFPSKATLTTHYVHGKPTGPGILISGNRAVWVNHNTRGDIAGKAIVITDLGEEAGVIREEVEVTLLNRNSLFREWIKP